MDWHEGGGCIQVCKGVLSNETDTTFAQARAIRCLLATADGSLWIGYGGDGLGRLKDGRFSHCRMDQGLHDDFISQILTDERGRLWFAGNRGIFSVRERELDEFAAGRVSRVQAVAYGQHEGLARLQASHGAWPGALRDQNGSLWFAMQSGYAVVQTENLKDNPDPPAVVLERVTINGKTVAAYAAGESVAASDASALPVALGQGVARMRLLPGQRQVEFTFTALSFKLPESLVFKYRLHGLDKDWVEAGHRRTASYPQVPAGDYRFQVLACNSDGVWNETGATVELTVMPKALHNTLFSALRAGACGYLLKRARPEEILEAIHEALHGGAPMSSEITRQVVAAFQEPLPPDLPAENLSRREQEILDQLLRGFSNKEIAARLSISVFTVKNHLRHIYDKLQVRSRTDAMLKFRDPRSDPGIRLG